jgi:ABC-type transport system involved in multi-copper enzyme maturation permease subunit
MKYLAILKDSLREAIDSKVIYVMIALSVLVTLFVLTTSYKPLSAEQMMTRLVKGDVIGLEELDGGGKKRRRKEIEIDLKKPQVGQYVVRGVEVVKGAPDMPDSSYRFTISQSFATAEEANQIRKAPQAGIEELKNRLAAAEQFGYFTVVDVRLASAGNRFTTDRKEQDPNDIYFEVTTEPQEGARLVWGSEFSLFLGAVPLGGGAPLGLTLFLTVVIVLWIGSWVTLLVSVIITAFFIPNMLRKGTVDLLLVKPIHRWSLLLYKYIGGLTFIFINTTVAIVGIWLALGLRSGIWANNFLIMIFVYTFFFAILYSVSTLFGVLTRSAIVAILVTCGIWFFLAIVGGLYGWAERERILEEHENVPAKERTSNNVFWTTIRAVHFVLPRTSDLDSLGNEALLRDFVPPKLIETARQGQRVSISWGESLTISGLFITLMLGLSCWWFATKDY